MKKLVPCLIVIILLCTMVCCGSEIDVSGIKFQSIAADGITAIDITSQGLSEGLVTCTFNAKNNTSTDKQIYMALILYIKETPQSAPKMVDVIFVNKTIKPMNSDILGAGFTVDNPQKLYVKTVLWNDLNTCKPYSASYTFTSKGLTQ